MTHIEISLVKTVIKNNVKDIGYNFIKFLKLSKTISKAIKIYTFKLTKYL